MIRKLSCLFVLAAVAAACGTEDPASSDTTDSTTNALEASGQVEFYVKVVGANSGAFRGESNNAAFTSFLPAFRYYSDITKGTGSSVTHCIKFQFTKQAGPSSPQFAAAIASGETLKNVHFDFVRSNNFIWQQVDLTGVRLSMVEQAVAPPDTLSPSVILEQETLVPSGMATVTLTSTPQNADGSAGASIVSTFTCVP